MKAGHILLGMLVVVGAVFARAQKAGKGDPCTVHSDCEPHLICEPEGKCLCPLGNHFNGSCLEPVRTKDGECHNDEQCFELFGANVSICHHKYDDDDDGGGDGSLSMASSTCACIAKYTIFDGDGDGTSKLCRLTCSKHEDCKESDQLTRCAPIQDGDGGNGLSVCQRADPDRDLNAEPDARTSDSELKEKSGLSLGAVLGIIMGVLLLVGVVAFVIYRRRRILSRCGC